MSYLLDTNVLSELVKQTPSPSVLSWVDSVDNEALYISVITIGEIRKGVAGIQNVERQDKISHWLEVELPAYFEDRILIIDAKIADRWGRLQSKNQGYILPAIDGLIAATAHVFGLTLVTCNTKDFIHTPIKIINPWVD